MMKTTIHDHHSRARAMAIVVPNCDLDVTLPAVVLGGGRSVRYLHQLPSHQIKYHDDPKK
jgi:hypothetical protein